MSLKHTFALFALLAAPAFSTTITFGTGGTTGFTTGGVNSVVVNNAGGVSGLTLTVMAGVLSPGNCAPQCWLTASSAGYGVDNSAPAGGASDGSSDIDGSGLNDFITLIFSRAVHFNGATFGNFGFSDDGSLYNTTSGATLITSFDTNSISGFNVLGTSFRFQATGDNDAYRLRSVTFVENPEPGTLGLTAVGLIGLLTLGRKRLRRVQ